jgi:hypothetical protein
MSHRAHSWPLVIAAVALALVQPAEARCRRAVLVAEAGPLSGDDRSHRNPPPTETELGEDPTAGTGAPVDRKRRPGIEAETSSPAPAATGLPASLEMPGTASGSGGAPVPATYTVAPGETLRAVLTRWADASGWRLVWEPTQDYVLSAPASFSGSFREASTQIMESLKHNGAPFGAELYTGNRVLRVTQVR